MNKDQSYLQRWITAFNRPAFRFHFIATIAVLLCILLFIPYCFNYIQERNGMVLKDPLLEMIGPADFSWITFTLIYSALFTSLISLSFSPERLMIMMQAYCVLTFLRVISLMLVPLNVPVGFIDLNDPVIAFIGYDGKHITKDLFFSGHVSTVFLLYLSVYNPTQKTILIIATICIASLILLQHVHYTIDVIVAPFFAFIAFRSAKLIQLKSLKAT